MSAQNGTRGAGGPSVELDMTRGKDREYLRRAVSNGWGVTEEDMRKYKAGLDEALAINRAARDAREINSCVKTMTAIVAQIQADVHLEAKLTWEESKPAPPAVVVMNIPAPRALEGGQ